MIRALFTAATGMIAQQLHIDTIANNLANVNTTGFKKSRVNFQDLLYETIKPAGTETAAGQTIPEGIQVGHGVRPSSIAKLFTPGNMIQTGNQLDLVIEGDGFFQVALPDGGTETYAYDANGNFIQLMMPSSDIHTLGYTQLDFLASYTPPGNPSYDRS